MERADEHGPRRDAGGEARIEEPPEPEPPEPGHERVADIEVEQHHEEPKGERVRGPVRHHQERQHLPQGVYLVDAEDVVEDHRDRKKRIESDEPLEQEPSAAGRPTLPVGEIPRHQGQQPEAGLGDAGEPIPVALVSHEAGEMPVPHHP